MPLRLYKPVRVDRPARTQRRDGSGNGVSLLRAAPNSLTRSGRISFRWCDCRARSATPHKPLRVNTTVRQKGRHDANIILACRSRRRRIGVVGCSLAFSWSSPETGRPDPASWLRTPRVLTETSTLRPGVIERSLLPLATGSGPSPART